jgi:hypothetical protein
MLGREATLLVPIDRRSVRQELRLLLQGVDGLAGEGLAAALHRAAEAATAVPARRSTRSPTGCRSPRATSPPTGAGPTCAT